MTTWTDISNASVAVGGIPSSATVTALRDNPSALAETASGAPVMRAGWHPVDKVSIGDTKDGLIYDFAVNGALSNIVTPDFEDGYEYRLVGSEITPSSSSTINLEIYKQTTGAYTTVLTLGSLDVTPRGFDLEFWTPRLSLKNHMGFGLSYIGVHRHRHGGIHHHFLLQCHGAETAAGAAVLPRPARRSDHGGRWQGVASAAARLHVSAVTKIAQLSD